MYFVDYTSLYPVPVPLRSINKCLFFRAVFWMYYIYERTECWSLKVWILQTLSEDFLSVGGFTCVCDDKQTCRKSCWKQDSNKLLPVNLSSSDRTVHAVPSQPCSQPGHSQLKIQKHRFQSREKERFCLHTETRVVYIHIKGFRHRSSL